MPRSGRTPSGGADCCGERPSRDQPAAPAGDRPPRRPARGRRRAGRDLPALRPLQGEPDRPRGPTRARAGAACPGRLGLSGDSHARCPHRTRRCQRPRAPRGGAPRHRRHPPRRGRGRGCAHAARQPRGARRAGRQRQGGLAGGSLGGAVLVALPLGILCHRAPSLRPGVLGTLNVIQTIPSIALFGILMVPLAALAASMPLAARLGIRGIGAAPAAVSLFLYSLLPITANTVAGLKRVPPAAVEAAHGMGMTRRQVLISIELILALPVILTGIRIVLVQNIGMVTIAALIGGGGLGTFVFQGIGQTAIDLVLLGAIPIVVLAFSAAVLLDALVEVMDRTPA